MNEKQLIDAVLEDVYRRLEALLAENSCSRAVVIGEALAGYTLFRTGFSAADWERVLITALAPSSLVRLASGSGDGAEEQFILEALLLGKPVYLQTSGLQHRKYRQSCYKPLYNHYLTCEQQLQNFGVQLLETPEQSALVPKSGGSTVVRKQLLTVTMAEKLAEQGTKSVSVAAGTLITPLAADLLREHRIAIEKL